MKPPRSRARGQAVQKKSPAVGGAGGELLGYRRDGFDEELVTARCMLGSRLLAPAAAVNSPLQLAGAALEAWRKEHPKLAEWAEVAVPESLTVFDFPAAHRARLRTTNGLERINRELRRRTRVASIFPNPDSCLRLISGLLAELDDEWMTGKVYLNLNP